MNLQTLFFLLAASVSLVSGQIDTASLADNTWVDKSPAGMTLPINGSNWAYENDLQGDPFFGLFIMAPGHVIHPQDCLWYPYDPVTNKWTKINSPTRAPRQCLSSFAVHAQDSVIVQWGGGEANHQWSQGGFEADYRSISMGGVRGNWIWAYELNRNRWHHMKGPAALPPAAASRYPEYDPIHDVSINAKEYTTYIYSFHNNRTVSLNNPVTFPQYGYANAVDTRRGLYYMFGSFGLYAFNPDNMAWSPVTTAVTPPGPWAIDGANSPGLNSMEYDPLHDIMLYVSDDVNLAGLPACRTWAFHCDTRQWEELTPAASPRDQGRLAFSRALNAFMLLGGEAASPPSRGGNTKGIWFYRYGSGATVEDGMATAPRASVSASGGAFRVTWNAVAEPGVTGYNVYRGTAVPFPKNFTRLNSTALTDTFYTDAGATLSTAYSYRVCAVKGTTEGFLSRHCYTVPGRVLGTVASVESAASVKVSWYANPERDIAGYNVYRAAGAAIYNTASFAYAKVNASLVTGTEFLDAVDLSDGVARGYVVTAVSVAGQESGYSGECTTFPNSPEWAWTIGQNTPTGMKMALRWQPPERTKIIGVNLYRCVTGGEKQNTAGLITDTGATLWTMPPNTGGTGYEQMGQTYVVRAVNMLNQEGFLTDQISPINTEYGYGIIPPSVRFDYRLYAAVEKGGGPGEGTASGGRALVTWPNPFNPSLSILVPDAPKPEANGSLKIYSLSGKLAADLSPRAVSGKRLSWDAGTMAAGVYVIRYTAGSLTWKTRAVLVK